MIKRLFVYIFFIIFSSTTFAQDLVFNTFKDRRVINAQSVETLAKRKLDIRIGHRFGDFAGASGGWSTLFGLENAADVLIGADYGVTDRLMLGLNRTKGAAALKQLINTSIKYRVVRQQKDGTPFSLTAYGLASVSTMAKSDNPESVSNFQVFSHRVMYNFQLILGRKFSDKFSLQVIPSWVHRNLVPFGEENDLISLGLASRIQLSRTMALLLDASVPFSDIYTTENDYYLPIGIGFEFDTGGHVFQLNLTNARGMIETDYLPNTRSNWGDGEYRLGFTISRLFNL